jgi:hypothetical protein
MSRRLATLFALLIATSAGVALALPSGAAANGCPLRISQGTAGTTTDPIRISTVADLDVLASNATCYASAYVFQQTANLALTSAFTPIGTSGTPFNGTYDGGGHTITGLTVTAANHAGFIGSASGATVRRLTLSGAQVTVTASLGGVLAGQINASTVEDVHVRTSSVNAPGTAGGNGFSGGLAGSVTNSTFSNVSSDATVIVGGSQAGGLIGFASVVTVTDATATGAVEATGGMAGGLIGDACATTITRGSASGAVRVGAAVGGGLIGSVGVCVTSFISQTYSITDSQATGAVSGTGLLGGFVGSLNTTNVTRSFATGNVTSTGPNAGGFAGTIDSGTITDSYALGAVSTPSSAGGFVAGIGAVTFERVYAAGAVRGGNSGGGLIEGLAPSSLPMSVVTASFWDTQTTGQASSLYGTGKTTVQMKTLATFADAAWSIASGWTADTAKTWGICGAVNGGYPYLLRQYTTTTEPCTVVPSAPLDPLATSQNERLLVTWKAPASDGGSAITSYTATAKPGGRSCTVAAPKLQCLITGLANGTSYVVSITAANKRGAGAIAKTERVAAAPPLGVPRVTQDGSTIITQISVNGPGTVSQVGALDTSRDARRLVRGLRPLCRASKAPKKAGTVTLRCTIDTSLLAAGSRRVRLTTQFKAKGGGIFTRRQTFVVRGTGTGTARPSNVTG